MDGVEHEAEESSSQRRERLLALRSAASASPAGAPPPAPSGSLLPDPELPGDQASCPRPRPPQRFDYYTNPAAAFSSSYSCGATNPTWSHKRKSPPACYDPRPAPPPPAYVFELVPSKATPRKRAIIVQRCARPQGVRWVGRSCAACSTFSPRCWSSRSVEEDAAAL